jgi:hypothetical protein
MEIRVYGTKEETANPKSLEGAKFKGVYNVLNDNYVKYEINGEDIIKLIAHAKKEGWIA